MFIQLGLVSGIEANLDERERSAGCGTRITMSPVTILVLGSGSCRMIPETLPKSRSFRLAAGVLPDSVRS